MSLSELKQECAALPPGEQKDLAAILALSLQQSRDGDEAAAVLDAPSCGSWMTLEEAQRRTVGIIERSGEEEDLRRAGLLR